MDISMNNALTAVSYGAVGCVGAMAAANAVLVGAGASAKASAYVADYFKNESVAQNLRIKGDQLISLAGKYAATEFKVAAALVAVGGSAALAQYAMDNEVPCDKNDDICIAERSFEKLGMCFDKHVNLTKYAEDVQAREDAAAKAKEAAAAQAKATAQAKEAAQAADMTLGALGEAVALVTGKVLLQTTALIIAAKVLMVIQVCRKGIILD